MPPWPLEQVVSVAVAQSCPSSIVMLKVTSSSAKWSASSGCTTPCDAVVALIELDDRMGFAKYDASKVIV